MKTFQVLWHCYNFQVCDHLSTNLLYFTKLSVNNGLEIKKQKTGLRNTIREDNAGIKKMK